MKILTDIGGTFARFVMQDGDTFAHSTKYRAADFPTLEDALNAYCTEHRLPTQGNLLIATAAYEDDTGDWRFVNKNKWVINTDNLQKAGWNTTAILNDFAAATWGLLAIKPEDLNIIQDGTPSNRPRCITGPGTGLGLGYLTPLPNNQYHVQRTHGGHMMASAATDEQSLIIKTIHQMLNTGHTHTPQTTVFEHMVSGSGLVNIYRALHRIGGQTTDIEKPSDILETLNTPITNDTLRLFHEFLSLHCRSAVITAHAYGGLTLTGGVLSRLNEKGLFDTETFKKFFNYPGVESVTQDLQNTPIHHFTGQHLAMTGLIQFEKHNKQNAS